MNIGGDNHHANWLECIRTRKRPSCDEELSHRTASLGHLTNIAFWTGRSLMSKTTETQTAQPTGDVVLQENWRIKDELSAARGYDVHRLFAEARERQKHSGHPLVELPKRRKA